MIPVLSPRSGFATKNSKFIPYDLEVSNNLETSSLDISHLSVKLDQISIRLLSRTQASGETITETDNPPQYESDPMQITTGSQSRSLDIEAQTQDSLVSGKGLTSVLSEIHNDGFQQGPCKRACSCACHSVYRVKSPSVLQSLVGSLLIKHNGLYGMNQACNENLCRRSASASIKVSYRFPEWLLNRMVSSFIVSNRLNGPQLSLVVPRIVPHASDIFFQASAGNLDGVANLLRTGLASPCDIDHRWGYTPLHYAVDKGHLSLCRLLLSAGARADITDSDENTVTDIAWNKICSHKISTEHATELEDVFKRDDWFEERQFTLLHKIVLDLLPVHRSLQQELTISTKDIEIADSEGRTPLSWAAECGNLPAVQSLVEFGANMSSKSIMGLTPLHYAAKAHNSACLSFLVERGAPLNAKNKWHQSPLNIASYFQNDASYFIPLLDHGADINESDSISSTALGNALSMNNDLTARCLISRGANINKLEQPGLTGLNAAIEYNSHLCISLLFESGVSLSTIGQYGETALHTVARRGDLRTMDIFQAARLEGLDTRAKTDAGLTAWDIMGQRVNVNDELEGAFRKLMAKLEANSSRVTYFDALEKIMPIVDNKTPDLVEVKLEEISVA